MQEWRKKSGVEILQSGNFSYFFTEMQTYWWTQFEGHGGMDIVWPLWSHHGYGLLDCN